jgi:anti-anti-sigma factor
MAEEVRSPRGRHCGELRVSTLYIGREEDSFFARISGRGDFGLGPALEEQALEAVEAGATTVVIDFQSCSYLDSTFLGALLSLALRLEQVHGQIILNCVSEWIQERFRTMGLARFFRVVEQPFTAAGGREDIELEPVNVRELSREETARYILRAHERLAEMCPSHQKHFQAVVEGLRRELLSEE